MRHISFSFLMAVLLSSVSFAQTPRDVKFVFTEATDLTMIGQFFPENPVPYHRVDTVRFTGFTKSENTQVRYSVGLACAFRTNSTVISVKAKFGTTGFPNNTNGHAARGFDLYIRKDGKWLFANSAAAPDKDLGRNQVVLNNMDDSEKECLLYFPLQSEEYSVQIGVQEGSRIEALPNPFRHRIAFFGSSFTHGSSTSRAGMCYPSQFSRATGYQVLNLGCAGNCKLQPYFCDVLCATEADAFVFDTFSNPSIAEIRDRLFPFIEKLQKAHPGKPLIFQRTIYRENRNFSVTNQRNEQSRQDFVDSIMSVAVKRYDNVYFIRKTNATSPTHETSVDGVHPGDYGYTLWAESIIKPVTKILRKYGLK